MSSARAPKKVEVPGHLNLIAAEASAVLVDQPDPNVVYPEVSMGHGKITAQFVYLTPERAAQLLSTRDVQKQRAIKDKHLAALMEDLQNGRFLLNGQTMLLDWQGRLIDGQHRAEAVVRTSVSIWVILIRGLDPQVFSSVDNIAKRSASDALKSIGHENTHLLGAVCAMIWRYERGRLLANDVASPSTIEDVIARHPAASASIVYGKRIKDCKNPSVTCFCHYLFGRIDGAARDTFFEGLATGAGLAKGNPILSLREKIRRVERRPNPHESLALFFKAWNAYRKHQSLTNLNFNPKKEAFPKPI